MSEIEVDVHHAVLDSAKGVFDARVDRLFCLPIKTSIFMVCAAPEGVRSRWKRKGAVLVFFMDCVYNKKQYCPTFQGARREWERAEETPNARSGKEEYDYV